MMPLEVQVYFKLASIDVNFTEPAHEVLAGRASPWHYLRVLRFLAFLCCIGGISLALHPSKTEEPYPLSVSDSERLLKLLSEFSLVKAAALKDGVPEVHSAELGSMPQYLSANRTYVFHRKKSLQAVSYRDWSARLSALGFHVSEQPKGINDLIQTSFGPPQYYFKFFGQSFQAEFYNVYDAAIGSEPNLCKEWLPEDFVLIIAPRE